MLLKVLFAIWGASLACSWWLFGGEVDTWVDRLLLGAATAIGLIALFLVVLL